MSTYSTVVALSMQSAWKSITVTDTGTKNNYAPGIAGIKGNTIVYCNNASKLTITGIAGGFVNQLVAFVGIGAEVNFTHNDAGSLVANRLTNFITLAPTPIGAAGVTGGVVLYQYISATAGWQIIEHESSQFVPAFDATHFVGNGSMTWTLQAGDVNNISYNILRRLVRVNFSLNTTTVGGTPNNELQITNGQFGGFTCANEAFGFLSWRESGVSVRTVGLCRINGSSSGNNDRIRLQKSGEGNWAAGTNLTDVYGSIWFEAN